MFLQAAFLFFHTTATFNALNISEPSGLWNPRPCRLPEDTSDAMSREIAVPLPLKVLPSSLEVAQRNPSRVRSISTSTCSTNDDLTYFSESSSSKVPVSRTSTPEDLPTINFTEEVRIYSRLMEMAAALDDMKRESSVDKVQATSNRTVQIDDAMDKQKRSDTKSVRSIALPFDIGSGQIAPSFWKTPNTNFQFCISALRIYLLNSDYGGLNKRLFEMKHGEISFGRDGVYLMLPQMPQLLLTENKSDTQLAWSSDSLPHALIMERYTPTPQVREAAEEVIQKLQKIKRRTYNAYNKRNSTNARST